MPFGITSKILLLIGVPVASVWPVIFVLPVEVQRINHSFTVTADPEFPNYGTDVFQFNPASFTADLGTDDEIAYTLRAPEGYKFQLGPTGGYLHLDMTFRSSVGGNPSPAGVRLDLENVAGAEPHFGNAILVFIPNEVRTFQSAVGTQNEFVRFSGAAGSFRGPLEFTAMTFAVAYPEGVTGMGPQTYAYQEGGLALTFFSDSATDPGPRVNLVPIPEPATVMLWAGSTLASLALWRRFWRTRRG